MSIKLCTRLEGRVEGYCVRLYLDEEEDDLNRIITARKIFKVRKNGR